MHHGQSDLVCDICLCPVACCLLLQCAAFDATDSIVAAGDVTGRILIWHNFPAALQEWSNGTAAGSVAAAMAIDPGSYAAGGVGAPVRLPACTTVHWHAHAVGAVCFSVDGSYLMSGGQEGVLVRFIHVIML